MYGCGLKWCIRVVVIALIIQSGHLISVGPHNGTAEILWNLTQLAIQSRQIPSQFELHPEIFSQYSGPFKPNPGNRKKYGQRPLYQPNLIHVQGLRYPKPIPPALPPGYQPYQQEQPSFMAALESLAINDDRRCVPKLLCELTSGGSSSQKQQSSSILPFNLNMESIIGLLSVLNGGQSSPIIDFGKAILLGYTSKGNTESCSYSYPYCPQDPDKLVEYLNNHNGGFFRLFNGNPHNFQRPQNFQQFPQYPQNYGLIQNQQHNYQQARIQSKPFFNILTTKPSVKFPDDILYDESNDILPQSESVVFPEESDLIRQGQNRKYRDRLSKTLIFPIDDFKLHKPAKQLNIFPDRTGTGEFRFDLEELYFNKNY